MPKPTKADLTKYKNLLVNQLAVLKGDVGSLRHEALRATDKDASVDNQADQGTDNYDQGLMLGLIENEEETLQLIEEAIDRLDGLGDFPFGQCKQCADEMEAAKELAKTTKKKASAKKVDPWILKARLEYLPWARCCVRHQEALEQGRESA